jgi:hypothetical protein
MSYGSVGNGLWLLGEQYRRGAPNLEKLTEIAEEGERVTRLLAPEGWELPPELVKQAPEVE